MDKPTAPITKKLFLFWDGEWEAGIPATETTLTLDVGNLFEFSNDGEDHEELEQALRAFGKDLAKRFDADRSETEKSIVELDAWAAKEAHHG